MSSNAYRRDLAATVGVVLVGSVWLATNFAGDMTISQSDSYLNFVGAVALFAAGPFCGWFLAVLIGDVSQALWSLIPLTFLSIWPALRARKAITATSRRIKLVVAGAFWLLSSLYYAVLIWI